MHANNPGHSANQWDESSPGANQKSSTEVNGMISV